jgi:hypothetical protein
MNHIGTLLGQHHRRQWAGNVLAEVDDPYAFERPGHM